MATEDKILPRRSSKLPSRSQSILPKQSLLSQTTSAATTSNRVLINVGGIRYETYRSTLKNIPDTRLAWLTESSETATDFDPVSGEYFFDRHPGLFNMILNYYRTGKLHVPTDVCGPLFEEELAFWGIEENQIEPCCWTTYRSHRDAQETLKELNIENIESEEDDRDEEDRYIAERFGIESTRIKESVTCWQRIRPKVWALLEDPNSSKGAKVLALISLMFVIISITTFCLESHTAFRIPLNESDPISNSWTTLEKNTKSRPVDTIIILDYVSIVFFTIEFVLRLIFSDNKKRFFCSLKNWIEIWAIVPFYIEVLIIVIMPSLEYNIYLQILKSLRLIRIFRILKLTRHFSGLQVLWKAIKASAKELLLLILFLFISVLIFACLVYYAEAVEESPQNDFKSIPIGFWWAVVTMTTLGYGDMYPRTALGYVVGVICSIAGVLVLALPVPVIVNNFSLYYSHAQAQIKLPKKRKRILVGARDELKSNYPMEAAHQQVESEGELESPESSQQAMDVVSPRDKRTLMRQASSTSIDTNEDPDWSEMPIPGRRKPRKGINVSFINEVNSPHITTKRPSRRKVYPSRRTLSSRSMLAGVSTSLEQILSDDGSPQAKRRDLPSRVVEDDGSPDSDKVTSINLLPRQDSLEDSTSQNGRHDKHSSRDKPRDSNHVTPRDRSRDKSPANDSPPETKHNGTHKLESTEIVATQPNNHHSKHCNGGIATISKGDVMGTAPNHGIPNGHVVHNGHVLAKDQHPINDNG